MALNLAIRRYSELQDAGSDEVSRRHTVWVVQVSRILQRCLGTSAHRGPRILSHQIDAEPSDNGTGVVFVKAIKGEAIVEQSRHLREHFPSHRKVHLGP